MYGADITVVGMYPCLRCGLLAVHIHSVILLACMPLLFPTFQWSACKTICRNELLSTSYFFVWDFAVIDEDQSETTEFHEVRMKNIRWHLAEGGFKEFRLVERLGEGKRPAAVIGEVADDMGLDLVVLSMESIHSKHIDSNLLAEFVPCPVLLLPL
jgi:hypothetical protein